VCSDFKLPHAQKHNKSGNTMSVAPDVRIMRKWNNIIRRHQQLYAYTMMITCGSLIDSSRDKNHNAIRKEWEKNFRIKLVGVVVAASSWWCFTFHPMVISPLVVRKKKINRLPTHTRAAERLPNTARWRAAMNSPVNLYLVV